VSILVKDQYQDTVAENQQLQTILAASAEEIVALKARLEKIRAMVAE
jgi:hypothetical protein